jgi:hypothetical protein
MGHWYVSILVYYFGNYSCLVLWTLVCIITLETFLCITWDNGMCIALDTFVYYYFWTVVCIYSCLLLYTKCVISDHSSLAR